MTRLRQSIINLVELLSDGKGASLERQTGHDHIADALFERLSSAAFAGRRWLICVDAADSPEVLKLLGQVYFAEKRDLMRGHVIFTSRSSDASVWDGLGVKTPMQLGTLPVNPAAELLYRYAKGVFQATSSEVEELIDGLGREERMSLFALAGNVEDCGLDGLPLALEQAGSYILRANRSFSEYWNLYESQHISLLSRVSAASQRDDKTDHENRCVATTWAINIEGLTDNAYDLLATIACLPPTRIPEGLVIQMLQVCMREQDPSKEEPSAEAIREGFGCLVLGELVSKFSILQLSHREPAAESRHKRLREYSIHRLVRLFVRDREATRLAAAEHRALKALYNSTKHQTYRTVTEANRDARSEMELISAHAKALLDSPAAAAVPNSCAVFNRTDGYVAQFLCHYDEAIKSYETALALFRRSLAEGETETIEIALTVNQLGNVLTSKGDHVIALEKCEEALGMLKRILGNEDPDNAEIAAVIHRIATIQEKLGNLDLALQFYQESLSMKKRIYGDINHGEIASTLYRIGNVLEAKKDYRGALERYLDSLNMKRNIYKDDEPRPDLAYALFSIGSVLHRQAALDKALVRFTEALTMRRRIYGEGAEHTAIAMALQQIGQVIFDQGNFEGAREKFSQAHRMRKAIFDPKHAEVLASHKSIAECDEALALSGGW